MTEFLRSEGSQDRNKAKVSNTDTDPNSAASANEPSVSTEKRALVTPPPSSNPPGAQVHTGTAAAPALAQEEQRTPLFTPTEANELRAKWDSVQVSFVDEPRRAVQQADELVSSAMKRLSEIFAEERQKMEQNWDRGSDVSTEDLRVALRRYRSFFGRVLTV